METDFSEFKQTNQFAEVLSSIPGIIDAYLANKMHEAVKTAVQLQFERLRDEAQAENADFLNKLDNNIKKIIKDQVKEQVKAQVSKILPKIEKTLPTYLNKRAEEDSHRQEGEQRRYDKDKDEEPFAGSNRGSKRRRAGKEPESTGAPKEKTSKTSGKSYEGSKSKHKTFSETAQTEEPRHTTKDLEEPAHQEFETGVTEDQPNEETPQFPDWFQRPAKLPTPDRDWNKTLPDAHGPVQPWLSSLAQKEDPRESFNELMDTPLDFSAFVMNQLKVDTLTPKLLTGLTFKLMKGLCKSLVELEYLFKEFYKATTEQLDWNNPEECGVKYWESAHDVYSKRKIIDVTKLEIVDWHNYKHFDWITVRRDDDKLYKFKEGDFNRLRIQDIKDMLLLLIQGKLTNLTVEEH
ncbi:hypothetical protein Tco_1498359, partial [Tanacetum coccineum]